MSSSSLLQQLQARLQGEDRQYTLRNHEQHSRLYSHRGLALDLISHYHLCLSRAVIEVQYRILSLSDGSQQLCDHHR
jgi:hypothetical protein